MSYILEALKKSDHERKQGNVPNLQTVHIPISVEQTTPWNLYIVILLLLLVLAFVVGLFMPKSTPLVELDSEDVEKAEVSLVSMPTQKAKVLPVQAGSEKEFNKIKSKINPEINQQVEKNQSAYVVDSGAVDKEIKANHVDDGLEQIPYLHELPAQFQQAVPELNFAGHIYSSQSSNRSVIINGRAMSEGDSLLQGIDVIEITPQGVVFIMHSQMFRVDVLIDWSFE